LLNKSSSRARSHRARRCITRFCSRHSGRASEIDQQRARNQRSEFGAVLIGDRHRFCQRHERRRELSVRQRDFAIEVTPRAGHRIADPALPRQLVVDQKAVDGAAVEIGVELERAIDQRFDDRQNRR
jgi:hypothetical protein